MIFDLEGCVVDTGAYEIRRQGQRVHVEPQVFDLLIMLLENRDRVVSKSEIIDRVWHGRSVSETALSSRVKSARRALGDDGASQNFIRTIRGRGFRFVGAVNAGDAVDTENDGELPSPVSGDSSSIAVLPFTNMSGDTDQLYFSDGITEDIITELSRSYALDVAARNSSFVYRDKAVNVQDVGRDLNVDFVLEGSVRKLGSRVRITAQLIDTSTGNHLWAEHYDRELDEIFDIQDDIIGTIVTALSGEIASAALEQARRRAPADWRAYDHYLMARDASQLSRTEANLAGVMTFAQRAVDADPRYAPGYSMLSNVYRWRSVITCFGDTDAMAQANADAHDYALKAAKLDPHHAETLRALGWSHLCHRNFAEADRCIARSHALSPHDSDIAISWAAALVYLGRANEAVALAEQTIRRSPSHPEYYLFTLADALFFNGDYDRAATILDGLADPEFDEDRAVAVATFARAGRQAAASRVARDYSRDLKELWIGPSKASTAERINWEMEHRHVFRRMKDIECLRGGLREAGLPA